MAGAAFPVNAEGQPGEQSNDGAENHDFAHALKHYENSMKKS
jgi:hypothetical protein